jgi:carbamoyltransferase
MNILGISAFYHDSAAALVRDGQIIAAAQEERFTRKKHDERFPVNAIRYCLAEGGVAPDGIDAVAFYEKPINKFARLLETYQGTAPRGLESFRAAMPIWLKKKLWLPPEMEREITALGYRFPARLLFTEHHEAHAASAFFPSPYPSAAVLTVDGVGEWACLTLGHGRDNRLDILKEIRFPHSLGLLYSAFTYFCGFRVNSGEYKLMGLAPYGKPRFVDRIKEHLIDIRDDGSFRLNLDCFGFLDTLRMTNDRFAQLFDGPARQPETEITEREMDLARSVQAVTEEVMLKLARHAREVTGEENLCLAGGVALNCVANGILWRSGIFKNIWIQPAAGDAGGALGAALAAWHTVEGKPRVIEPGRDAMQGAYLGPEFSDDEIAAWLAERGYPARRLGAAEWAPEVAKVLAEENVVGLVQGRMEFGPRALGGRSIIGDPRSPRMQAIMNLRIKYRESFRPFAPAVLEERVGEYFEHEGESPYMLLVAPVRRERCLGLADADRLPIRERIHQIRSDLPAITHVDYSARVQTVSRRTNPRFHDLISAFAARTGCAVLINTSFNVRGEPIVCTPEDAYRCFMRTEMDALVLGSHLLLKQDQPAWPEDKRWQVDYVLD